LRSFTVVTAVFCGLWASLAAAALAPAAAASPPYAAMAVDANTGAVLHNQSGDAPRYPASLTKMMTLYMTFELIELGRLDYDSKIKMTEEAAGAAPSKLDLDPGVEISVLDAIKALVTKSANDVAVALAQHIGGTEANFARLMTAKAREIGMTHTVFKNASGLPDGKQHTTARDMLTLALRLQDEFPRHYKLFATRTFSYGGRTYRNHNTLLGRYRGVDGIKTGYTRASGFNLVTSVRRGRKHVVAAVFGGRTAKVRNAHMRSLLNTALKKASTKVTRKPALAVHAPQPVRAKPPARSVGRPPATELSAPRGGRAPSIAIARVRTVRIGADPRASPAPRQTQPGFAAASVGGMRTQSLGARAAAQGPGLAPSTLQAQADALGGSSLAASNARGTTESGGSRGARAPAGPFAIQIGAYADSGDAERHMATARQRAGGALDPYHAVAIPVQLGGNQLYRARFRGFDKTAAASTCLQLRRLQIDCFVVRTE